MTTVQIARDVSDEAFQKIQAYLDDLVLTDPDWNGAEITLERDDYTCIPDNSSEDAMVVMVAINHIIAADLGTDDAED